MPPLLPASRKKHAACNAPNPPLPWHLQCYYLAASRSNTTGSHKATYKPEVREHSAVTRGELNRQRFASLSSPSFPALFWTPHSGNNSWLLHWPWSFWDPLLPTTLPLRGELPVHRDSFPALPTQGTILNTVLVIPLFLGNVQQFRSPIPTVTALGLL